MTHDHQVNQGTEHGTVILSDVQLSKIFLDVENSFHSWLSNHLSATPEQQELQKKFLRESITNSVSNGLLRNGSYAEKSLRYKALKAQRGQRVKELNNLARDEGMRFLDVRFFKLTGELDQPSLESTHTLELLNQGGFVFLAGPDMDDARNFSMEYTVSICNPSDNFDLVQGMELAWSRFKQGMTLFELSHWSEPRFYAADFSRYEQFELAETYLRQMLGGSRSAFPFPTYESIHPNPEGENHD